MPGRWSESRGAHPERSPGARGGTRGPRLYEIVLREAIATQHDLALSDRLELRACEACGKAYLLIGVWLPLSEQGAIGCPRCGSEILAWDGARGYMAYWQREAELPAWPGSSRVGRPRRVAR